MKILFITPKFYPTISGNTITVERISKNLRKRKVKTKVVTTNEFNEDIIKKFNPDIIHRFHATKTYVGNLDIPTVLTFTGTDFNVDLYDKKKQKIFKKSIEQADCVTFFHQRARIVKEIKNITKISLQCSVQIPESVSLENSLFHFKKKFGLTNEFIFLLVAGMRKVKDPLYAVKELEQLKKEFPSLVLIILGEASDDFIVNNIKKHKWIKTGLINHKYMKEAYKAVDIVLNTSNSEGMSNAVNEAMYMNKLVLASDISGNAHVPKKFRFKKKPGELAKLAKKFMMNPKKPIYKKQFFSPIREAKEYLKMYRKVIVS